jgi:uncharacterized Zn-binding protein involved in type VI secretion
VLDSRFLTVAGRYDDPGSVRVGSVRWSGRCSRVVIADCAIRVLSKGAERVSMEHDAIGRESYRSSCASFAAKTGAGAWEFKRPDCNASGLACDSGCCRCWAASGQEASEAVITAAETATKAAAGTPGAPAALAAEQATKAAALVSMSSTIMSASAGADIHLCATPLPLPPHGPGVVINGSTSVMINNLPAARQGDTILEALGPTNSIVMGCPTVNIGP